MDVLELRTGLHGEKRSQSICLLGIVESLAGCSSWSGDGLDDPFEEQPMQSDVARKLLDIGLRQIAEQDIVLAEIQALCTPEEYARYQRMMIDARNTIVSELVEPIVAKYPALADAAGGVSRREP